MTYEFAIKKDILKSGKEIFTPVTRKKTKLFSSNWQRITELYGVYMLLELDFTPELTYEQCKEHILKYQEAQIKKKEGNVEVVEFHDLEEKDL